VSDLRQRLDRLVPVLHREGEWERVVADAGRSRTKRLSLVLPFVAAAAAVAILALAWPFGSERSRGVLDRALAAIGEGPVLHIVYRGEWGPTRVDLSSGDVTAVVAESEVWYDPKRGVNHIDRLDGEIQREHLTPVRELSVRQVEQYVALADNYQAALQAGKARVVAPGRVGDREVWWIRTRSEWLPDSSDGRNHLFAEEVAVDRETYEPVYARSTRDGRAPPGVGAAIVKLERLEAGSGDFEVDKSTRSGVGFMLGAGYGRLLERGEFSTAVGGTAFWLGPSFDGKPLADAREFFVQRRKNRDDQWQKTRGLYLFYGKLRRRNGVPLRALARRKVELEQFREPPRFWIDWPNARVVRDGAILISSRSGVVLRDGTYVLIRAESVQEILGAATALRAVGDPAPTPSDLDLDRIAREVEARKGHVTEVSGGKPVAPRPIVVRRGKLVQTASAHGISVRVYSGGVIRFDTRTMDEKLKRVVPRELRWHCFRLRNGVPEGWGGGYGLIPRNGFKSVAVVGHLPRGPRRHLAVKPPFDACEFGTGFGRDWLRRFGFHGMLEIPLTRRGTRYFEDRAAARELAYFVRSGPRRMARREMRAGRPAPPAERLRARGQPHIDVVSSGARFRVTLTAPTGRRFFVEIVRGSIRRTNARDLAAAYLR
jgi:hypothetical protein